MAITYEVLSVSKDHDEAAIRAGLAQERPGFKIEAIVDTGDEWNVRIAADDDEDSKPDFLKKKKDDSAESDDSDTDDSDAADSDDAEDSDDSKEDGEKKGDPVGEIKGIIDQLNQLFRDLGGKTKDLADAHDEKADKLKDISDTVGEDGMPKPGEDLDGMPPMPPDLKGMPGGPGAPPRSAPVPGGKKRPGAPPGIPTFTHTEIINHPGVDDNGNRLSLSQVVAALEGDEEFATYNVVALSSNRDGSYSAKLAQTK